MRRVERTIRFKLHKECHVCGEFITKGLCVNQINICMACEEDMVGEKENNLYEHYVKAVKQIWKNY
ncbi:sigma factor G inhibitor Gin [Shouchella sp. JSM 1781072]|uniref:sigma factor G inhibitor Gin n=1 Tax=Shouchella sp. JSM 1781072 TaxID=3344581 RepID=UPI0035C0C551